VTFSADSRVLAVGGVGEQQGDPGAVVFWNVENGERIRVLDWCSFGDRVRDVAFSPDGKTLAIVTERATRGDNSVSVLWKLAENLPSVQLTEVEGISCIAFSPDGSRLVAGRGFQQSGKQLGEIIFWAIANGADTRENRGEMVRTWTDSTGRFQIRATFVKHDNGEVILRKADGRELILDLVKLSEEDQRYIRSR
jgi:WD40 repeat protein